MDVSVVIVNYNTKKLTQECIDSVFNQTSGVEFEVILVDNASIDGSVELFENDKRLTFIKSETNLGFGKANNLGFQYSKGKYIFLLNSDTLLLDNAIKVFYEQMEKRDSRISCMGCFLVDANNQRIHSYGEFPSMRNELFRRPLFLFQRFSFVDCGFDGTPISLIDDTCFEVEYVTGADLFIRREVINKLGLFNPDFFLYYEETEMQYRYKKSGYKNVIIKYPMIMHLVGGSKTSSYSPWRGNDLKSLFLCYKIIHGNIALYFFKIVLLLFTIPIITIDIRFSVKERLSYVRKIFD